MSAPLIQSLSFSNHLLVEIKDDLYFNLVFVRK